jgi:hypothetical protein
MAAVTVRYIVDDVDEAIAFYVEQLGFGVVITRRRPLRCSSTATCTSP